MVETVPRIPTLESVILDEDATLRTLTPEMADAVLWNRTPAYMAPEQSSFWDGERFVSWIRVEMSR